MFRTMLRLLFRKVLRLTRLVVKTFFAFIPILKYGRKKSTPDIKNVHTRDKIFPQNSRKIKKTFLPDTGLKNIVVPIQELVNIS